MGEPRVAGAEDHLVRNLRADLLPQGRAQVDLGDDPEAGLRQLRSYGRHGPLERQIARGLDGVTGHHDLLSRRALIASCPPGERRTTVLRPLHQKLCDPWGTDAVTAARYLGGFSS